jgi:hypothetical protein
MRVFGKEVPVNEQTLLAAKIEQVYRAALPYKVKRARLRILGQQLIALRKASL